MGRGFRYQDLVTTAFLAEMHAGVRAAATVIPEGWDDIAVVGRDTDELAQVKSRQPHLGPFPTGDVARHIVDGWERNEPRLRAPQSQFTLVLEQPIADAEDIDGPVPGAVADLIRSRGGLARKVVEDLLQRTRVRVLRDPLAHAAQLLAQSLGGEPGQYVVHLQALRAAAGEAADANANASEQTPASVTITDVTRILDDINQTVDRDQLDAVLTSGVCEPIDFLTPLDDPAFYLGVDVVPGHVTAGLVLERPDVLATIDDSLEQRRPVLITGPSGAGKSAAMYLAAYLDRGRRWYRIRRLEPQDVAKIVDFARSLRPARFAPIGFVVDDVGRTGRDGWDDFVTELSFVPGVALVGAARTEDLFVIRTLSQVQRIPLELTHDVAEAVFSQLAARGQTSFPYWIESFEASHGLMLEYVHLLTRGERLDVVIADQVERGSANDATKN